jgi:hypothetical protein
VPGKKGAAAAAAARRLVAWLLGCLRAHAAWGGRLMIQSIACVPAVRLCCRQPLSMVSDAELDELVTEIEAEKEEAGKQQPSDSSGAA